MVWIVWSPSKGNKLTGSESSGRPKHRADSSNTRTSDTELVLRISPEIKRMNKLGLPNLV